MALTLGDNFSYQGAKPLDARLKYDTLANMKAVADATMYDGCMAYCSATDKTYQWKSTNTVDADTGKWREFSSGGGTSDYSNLTNKPQINGVTLSGNKSSSDLELQEVMQLSSTTDATVSHLGKVYQYIGNNTTYSGTTFTHGHFYEVYYNSNMARFEWREVSVNASVTYTAGDGIDITSDVISTKQSEQGDIDEIIDVLPSGGNVAVTGYVPLGTVISVYSETAPQFFLACDGTTYNKSDYPELAAHLLSLTTHSQYEVDGDDTKFKVPDLRGEFIRGTGTNGHTDQGSGANVGVHQDGTGMTAWACYSDSFGFTAVPSSGGTSPSLYNNADSNVNVGTRRGYLKVNYESSTADDAVFAIPRPTNTSVLFCIAYKDIYSNPMNDYSTEEKAVGTWIDGKPIWQRTVLVQNVANASTYNISSWNIDEYVDIKGFTTDTVNGNHVPLTYSSGDSSADGKFSYWYNTTTVGFHVTNMNNQDVTLTIQYTKTT